VARPAGAPPPAWLDLGCGDLALLAPLLPRLPLGHHTGLDLAEAVLPLAQRTLGGGALFHCRWMRVAICWPGRPGRTAAEGLDAVQDPARR
jgi:trans-aconitate methyltransferase